MSEKIEIVFNGIRGTRGTVSAKRGADQILTDRIDIAVMEDRERFILKLIEKCPGIERAAVDAELERLAGEAAERAADKPNQADLIVKLTDDAELFCFEDTEFVSVIVENPEKHRETYRIRDKSFRKWLQHRYYNKFGRTATNQAMGEALDSIESRANFGGKIRISGIRLINFDNRVYLDLCDELWRVIEIDRDGWRICADPPVRFIRKQGMQLLPMPERGGKIDELRGMLNAKDDDNWVLIVAWIIGAMNPRGPFPILAVNGEQGSAKSTLCDMLRRLIDPNRAAGRSAPRDERDLAVAAENSWVMYFDNLSTIRPELSDALCRLAKGAGFSTRKLYSDEDEKLFSAARPVMFNGIEDLANRSDLLDRSILIFLPRIDESERVQDLELDKCFRERHPRILGAILEAVSAAIRHRADTKLAELPRMADFAVWVAAAEGVLGWKPGTFLEAYRRNRKDANQTALEASPVGQVVRAFMESREKWSGSASELLAELERTDEGQLAKRERSGWPTSAKGLADQLRRVSPNLLKLGLDVETGKRIGKDRKRIIELRHRAETSSATSAPSAAGGMTAKAADQADESGGNAAGDRPPDRPLFEGKSDISREADEADANSFHNSPYALGM